MALPPAVGVGLSSAVSPLGTSLVSLADKGIELDMYFPSWAPSYTAGS